MILSNRASGNSFEREFADTLRPYGFWVHILVQNSGGQPADMLAIRGRYHALIDCKVISAVNRFRFSRIEPNQHTSMRLFGERCLEPGWFALKWPNGEVTMLSHDEIVLLEQDGVRSVRYEDRLEYGISLDEWLRRARSAD